MLLLWAAPVGQADAGMINARYVAGLMANDWGFYYTSTTNLKRVKEAMEKVPALTAEHRAVIGERADQIIKAIEDVPKSLKWKWRARTGVKQLWYNEVSDWA